MRHQLIADTQSYARIEVAALRPAAALPTRRRPICPPESGV
jgi:hypothetical protein